jgi:hypothetical protein
MLLLWGALVVLATTSTRVVTIMTTTSSVGSKVDTVLQTTTVVATFLKFQVKIKQMRVEIAKVDGLNTIVEVVDDQVVLSVKVSKDIVSDFIIIELLPSRCHVIY